MQKVRSTGIALALLGLVVGFQNCGGAIGIGDVQSPGIRASVEKTSLVGRYEVERFVATSGCPDVEASPELNCTMVFSEENAQTSQVVEFMSDGTLIVEGACNTYYSNYAFLSGNIATDPLTGTSVVCDGIVAEEENLLVYRLNHAVKLFEEGPQEVSIYTDQSSGLRLRAL